MLEEIIQIIVRMFQKCKRYFLLGSFYNAITKKKKTTASIDVFLSTNMSICYAAQSPFHSTNYEPNIISIHLSIEGKSPIPHAQVKIPIPANA